MAVAPYRELTIANATWSGYYAPRRECFALLFTPNPTEFPPPAGGWKVLVIVHGGGMRQWGRGVAEQDNSPTGLYFANNFGCAVIFVTYRPGGHEYQEIETPNTVVWPDHLRDVANAVQFFKSHATDTTIVGASGALSTDADDWAITGLSAGGYLAVATQLQPDGAFAYSPAGSTEDPRFGYTHSHLVNSVRSSSGQLVFSTLDSGSANTGDFPYDTYGEFGWAGSYFYRYHYVQQGGTWDDFDADVKKAAEPIGQLVASNPRVFEVSWYLHGEDDTLNHGDIRNLADDTNSLSFLHSSHFTRGTLDPDFTSLHAHHQNFWFAYLLDQLNHTRWRMKVGSTTSNPTSGAAVANPDGSASRAAGYRTGPTGRGRVSNVTYLGTTVTVTFAAAHKLAYNVSSVTYVGTTVTVTLDRTHHFFTGDSVTISGVTSTLTLAGLVNATHTLTDATSTTLVFETTAPSGTYSGGGFAVRGQVTFSDITSSLTLASVLNGSSFTIASAPSSTTITLTVGSTPTGSYTSGGYGYVTGSGGSDEDFYSHLIDATYGPGWSGQ